MKLNCAFWNPMYAVFAAATASASSFGAATGACVGAPVGSGVGVALAVGVLVGVGSLGAHAVSIIAVTASTPAMVVAVRRFMILNFRSVGRSRLLRRGWAGVRWVRAYEAHTSCSR